MIGAFYIIVMLVGTGARAILGQTGESAVGETGNLALLLLAEELGGGSGSAGGDVFLAAISAVALATILAVVAGLVDRRVRRRRARPVVERGARRP